MEDVRVEQEGQLDFDTLLRDNRGYQSAFDRKVDKALQTARANWEREQEGVLEQQREQALTQARAQAEQEYDGRMAQLASREEDYDRRLRQVETADRLVRLGLSPRFAPWLTGETSQDSQERVEQFEAVFRQAVADMVTERMAGQPPQEPQSAGSYGGERLRSMSPQEINAHWAQIQDALKG